MSSLKEYRDKTYIYSILTSRSSEYFNTLKSICNVPLILASSVMSILNSSFDPNNMQITNVIINAFTAFLIAMISNFKIPEKASTFHAMHIKYMALLHDIEDKLACDTDIDTQDFRQIVARYDELLSQTDDIPKHIKNKVRSFYLGKKYLPVILCGDSPNLSEQPSRPLSEAEQQQIIICDLQNTQL